MHRNIQSLPLRSLLQSGILQYSFVGNHAGISITKAQKAWVQTLAQGEDEYSSQLVPHHHTQYQPSRQPFHPLDFCDGAQVYQHKTSFDMARSLAVFQTCQMAWLVKRADWLLAQAKKVVGKRVVNGLVRHTFFAQFCAGEDQESIQPTLQYLHRHGIGSILDYAAEDDVHQDEGPASRAEEVRSSVVARTYDYENERRCDSQMNVFKRSIEAAAVSPGQGFTAIKVTALGNPQLLERMSDCILGIRQLFKAFDKDQTGLINIGEFVEVYNEMFANGKEELISELFHRLDFMHQDQIDYISFTEQMRFKEFAELMTHCKHQGPLFHTALTEEELSLVKALRDRVKQLAQLAHDKQVRLMIDAEHTYFQPAIDHLCLEMQREFNTEVPVVYNTYQCYLKSSMAQLIFDLERAKRHCYKVGVKLVRGAYMELERERAANRQEDDPIHPSKEATDANYNKCIELMLDEIQVRRAELMIASHNQESIEQTVATMYQRGMEPQDSGVFFGQLLGMADHLTFTLGRRGYSAYKYVPFGPIEEVMPYLIRRAQENSSIAKGVKFEMSMMTRELLARANPFRASVKHAQA